MIRESDGEVTLDSLTLSGRDAARLVRLPAAGKPRSMDLAGLGGYRVMAVPGRDGDVLVSGLPTREVDATVHRLELIEVVVFGAALVATGIAGAAWVGVSLRPLRRVAATALEVTELPLASGEVTLPSGVPEADPATEVGRVGAAFNHMLAHVEAALTQRQASEARLRQFVADASHELRTPLAAIRSYTELARRTPDAAPSEVGHALGRVEAESIRMGGLVDDLLLLARLDAGRPLAREPVDLTRLAIDATSDARVAGPRHCWLLKLPDEPVTVDGDGHRLHQVLANLLSNARTHTPPGTTVTVRVAPAAADRPDAVELSVTDDGPGIPADLRPRVFERFVRADSSRSRTAGSTGLGLAIVAAVVHAHRGDVTVESRPGRTCMRILLPAGGAAAAPVAATSARKPG